MDKQFAWAKQLSNYFAFNGKDAIGVVEASKARLAYIRRIFTFAGAVALYVSLEVNSPKYSVLELVRSLANGDAGGATPVAFAIPGHDPVSAKLFIKFIAFVAFYILLWAQISFTDPLSNNLFLRRVSADSAPRRNFWRRMLFRACMLDEKKFASLLPSSRLPRICSSCAHSNGCGSYVQSDAEFIDSHSFNVWRSIYYTGRMEPEAHKRLAAAALKVRAFYYFRKVALVVGYGAILMFLTHRALELLSKSPPEYPPLAFAMFALPFVAAWFFGIISDPTAETHEGGIWAELKSATDEAIAGLNESDGFKEVYQNLVCRPKISARAFSRAAQSQSGIEPVADAVDRHGALIGRLLSHMDELVTEKLGSVILTNQNIKQSDHPSRVLGSAICFYERAFPSGAPFYSQVIKDLNVSDYASIHDHGANLAESIAADIQSKGYFFTNRRTAGVNTKFRSDVGSLLILPIKIQAPHRERIRKLLASAGAKAYAIDVDNTGWFLLTSRHDRLFTSGSMPFHLQVLSPFVHRLYVELVRDSLVKRKGGR